MTRGIASRRQRPAGQARRSTRAGFVLLAVLWVLVGASVTGLGLVLLARRAAASARNRRDEARAEWVAEDCAARVRAVIAQVLAGQFPAAPGTAPSWRALDRSVEIGLSGVERPMMPRGHCRTTVVPSGRALDVNTADAELLARAFQQLGVAGARVDSLVDALMDWRDSDDVPRPFGAERAWYVGRGRSPPRNAPFADVRELRHIRGFEHLAGIDSIFGVEPGRVVLDRAPLAVIAALPGFTTEAVARVAELRARGAPIGDLLALSARLSPAARRALLARYPDLVRLTTSEPESWTLAVDATVGDARVTVALEERLVRAGPRVAVIRRRTWVE